MEQIVEQYNLEEALESVGGQEGVQVSVPVAHSLPSYQPTRWAIVNRVLDIVDRLTGGRADWVVRFFSYCLIGGFAALVNLAVFAFILYAIPFPGIDDVVHNLIAFLAATEISLLANFIPNDYFTFRRLAGHERTWWQRCVRYHLTSIVGSLLTYMIQFGFRYAGHVSAFVGQAIALILVLIYNFSFHHIFTYRHVKTAEHAAG